MLVNTGALQQPALLRIVRTAPALQPKYAAALAALATSADPLTSAEAIRLLGTSALLSPLPAATCLATLEAGVDLPCDVPIDAVITTLTAFTTAGLLRLAPTVPTAGVPSAHPPTAMARAFLHSSGVPGHPAPAAVSSPVGLHPKPVIGQNTFIGVPLV